MRNTLCVLVLCLMGSLLPAGAAPAQVLATVGEMGITSSDLDAAIASSPMAVQFPSMDADVQATLRGDMLKRIVASRLLFLEAQRQGLDKSQEYLEDVASYRNGYLYRAYMDRLRGEVKIDEATLADWQAQYKGENDALEAAKSQEIAQRYKLLKTMALEFLKQKYHLQVFEARLAAGAAPETVLATADAYQLTLGQLYDSGHDSYNQEKLQDALYRRLELDLVVQAAQEDGLNAPVARYAEEALPSLLMSQMEKSWIRDEKAMRDYYQQHPSIGEIVERRHIVQLVVASRKEAEALRQQATSGAATLYQLAAKHSIDPYGHKQAGDMGWLPAGSGMPQLESVIANLKDGELSGVIESPQGFHLVMIEERVPSKQRPFEAVKDRVRQAMVNASYPAYLVELQKRFPVKWGIPMVTDAQTAEGLMQH